MLVYSAADFEDFREPRPELPPNMEADLERVVRHLAQVKWPFRLHATYDETIGRALDVFERVNRDVPLAGVTLVLRSRGDDLAAQHRSREGAGRRHRRAAPHGVPGRGFRAALRRGNARGDAADQADTGRRSSAGRGHRCHARGELQPVGLAALAGDRQDHRRAGDVSAQATGSIARRRCGCGPQANTWFSNEEGKKGVIKAGQLADLAVLSADYMTVPEAEIRNLVSVLTRARWQRRSWRRCHSPGSRRRCRPPAPTGRR